MMENSFNNVMFDCNSIMQFFTYSHLPEKARKVSEPFCVLAQLCSDELPVNDEKLMALRKLLEAKDCAVRSVIYKPGYNNE